MHRSFIVKTVPVENSVFVQGNDIFHTAQVLHGAKALAGLPRTYKHIPFFSYVIRHKVLCGEKCQFVFLSIWFEMK